MPLASWQGLALHPQAVGTQEPHAHREPGKEEAPSKGLFFLVMVGFGAPGLLFDFISLVQPLCVDGSYIGM